jgi:hypothetical protein
MPYLDIYYDFMSTLAYLCQIVPARRCEAEDRPAQAVVITQWTPYQHAR